MMLVRIVKMVFKKDTIADFEQLFLENRTKIKGFKGCTFLELYRDKKNPAIFFTYSHWENTDYLEEYRQSEFFQSVWARTKTMFDRKPEAWSLTKISNSEI